MISLIKAMIPRAWSNSEVVMKFTQMYVQYETQQNGEHPTDMNKGPGILKCSQPLSKCHGMKLEEVKKFEKQQKPNGILHFFRNKACCKWNLQKVGIFVHDFSGHNQGTKRKP